MLMIDIKSRFGTAVRIRRKGLGISQEQLAERAGLHRTYVADVERGARNLSLASIEKLAQGLDVPIPALFPPPAGGANPAAEGIGDILLVENDARDVELTLNTLEAANLTNPVTVARDGAEALEFLFCTGRYSRRKPQPQPQIILLDLNLPKVSGLEVLRQIKGNRQIQAIPVVVLTSSERQHDVSESLRLGAETYMRKPVDFNRFASAVSRLKLGWALLPRAATHPA